MSRTSTSQVARVKRTPISGRNVLTVNGKEPGYVYRIVNDSGDRIAQFQAAGYELVDAKDVTVGDKRINQTTAEGSKAQVNVGKGEKAFVMRIREEWYKEDQEAKQSYVNQLEQSIKLQASTSGLTGTVTIKTGQD